MSTVATRIGAWRLLSVRRIPFSVAWSMHCRGCDLKVLGYRNQGSAIDDGHRHLASCPSGGIDAPH